MMTSKYPSGSVVGLQSGVPTKRWDGGREGGRDGGTADRQTDRQTDGWTDVWMDGWVLDAPLELNLAVVNDELGARIVVRASMVLGQVFFAHLREQQQEEHPLVRSCRRMIELHEHK
eukprot:1179914-Prorocentrum_minimum.AAC.3